MILSKNSIQSKYIYIYKSLVRKMKFYYLLKALDKNTKIFKNRIYHTLYHIHDKYTDQAKTKFQYILYTMCIYTVI